MEDKQIPYFVHEANMARMERGNKRLWIVLIIAIILLFITNALWLYEWMSYDEVIAEEITDVDIDSGNGVANYIGNDGDITNGKDTSENN